MGGCRPSADFQSAATPKVLVPQGVSDLGHRVVTIRMRRSVHGRYRSDGAPRIAPAQALTVPARSRRAAATPRRCPPAPRCGARRRPTARRRDRLGGAPQATTTPSATAAAAWRRAASPRPLGLPPRGRPRRCGRPRGGRRDARDRRARRCGSRCAPTPSSRSGRRPLAACRPRSPCRRAGPRRAARGTALAAGRRPCG